MIARTLTSPPVTRVAAMSPTDQIDAYLRMLAGPRPRARLLDVRFALRHGGMGQVFIAAHSAPGAGRFIRRLAAKTDVYVGVALRDRAAGGRDAIRQCHLAFVEIDAPDALDRLAGFAHRPTMTITSGTQGHAHAYWALATVVGVAEIERLNRRLAERLGADPASTDAARILRPPATWNHKHSPPAGVGLVECDSNRRYELAALVAGLRDPVAVGADAATDPHRAAATAIDQALLAIPAAEYVEKLTGLRPNRAGKIACPFHDDHTPSLQLYNDGTWYCFGACRTGGSIYDYAARLWAIKTQGASFLQLRTRLLRTLELDR